MGLRSACRNETCSPVLQKGEPSSLRPCSPSSAASPGTQGRPRPAPTPHRAPTVLSPGGERCRPARSGLGREDATAHGAAGWRLTGDIQGKTRTRMESPTLRKEGSRQPRNANKVNPGSHAPNLFDSHSRIGGCQGGSFLSRITHKRLTRRRRKHGAILERYFYFKSRHV